MKNTTIVFVDNDLHTREYQYTDRLKLVFSINTVFENPQICSVTDGRILTEDMLTELKVSQATLSTCRNTRVVRPTELLKLPVCFFLHGVPIDRISTHVQFLSELSH